MANNMRYIFWNDMFWWIWRNEYWILPMIYFLLTKATFLFIMISISWSWGNLVPFEHGWSYRKNFNAGICLFSYRFMYKIFRMFQSPVFCPVSGFVLLRWSYFAGKLRLIYSFIYTCLDGPESNFLSGWSGMHFSVRFPVL